MRTDPFRNAGEKRFPPPSHPPHGQARGRKARWPSSAIYSTQTLEATQRPAIRGHLNKARDIGALESGAAPDNDKHVDYASKCAIDKIMSDKKILRIK